VGATYRQYAPRVRMKKIKVTHRRGAEAGEDEPDCLLSRLGMSVLVVEVTTVVGSTVEEEGMEIAGLDGYWIKSFIGVTGDMLSLEF